MYYFIIIKIKDKSKVDTIPKLFSSIVRELIIKCYSPGGEKSCSFLELKIYKIQHMWTALERYS